MAVGLAALLSLLAIGPAAAGTLNLRAESTAEIGLDGETLVSHLINRGFAVERPYDHATGRFVPLLLRRQVDVVRRSDAELLWKDPMGVKMSLGAIVLMLLGSYAIKKIVDIKV